VTELVRVDTDFVNPCWVELILDLKNVRNMVSCNKVENFRNKSNYGSVITNTRTSSFIQTETIATCLRKVV
jgi:hypothetical protein